MDFDRKTVIVTGAAGNLGRAVANTFAARGARLVLVDRSIDALEAVAPNNCERLLLPLDLLDSAAVQAAVAQTSERFGAIDVLCNVAGGFRMGEAVHEISDETFDFLFDLNTRSLLHTVRAVVPGMLAAGKGKVVNISAFAAQHGSAQMGAYSASKAAVIRLTEAMAAELRERGINVNCVLPTIIDTPENRKAMPDADPARWVSLIDLANVILFLASDASRAIHGAAVPVSGLS